MTALATVEELEGRLPFELDVDERREAEGALEDLSDDARFYGKSGWVPGSVPREVKNLVLRAAARHMKNYDGFIQSRAGDETVTWTDRGENAGSAYFTEREIKKLRGIASRSGIHTVPASAWGDPGRNVAPKDKLVRDEHGFLLPMYQPGADL